MYTYIALDLYRYHKPLYNESYMYLSNSSITIQYTCNYLQSKFMYIVYQLKKVLIEIKMGIIFDPVK